jgi:hypothetical protein
MKRDLVVLVADKNMEGAVRGLVSTPARLGIRSITLEVFVHPQRDPGCRTDAHNFLRSQSNSFSYALVMFDYEGSGENEKLAADIQVHLERQLGANGWPGRSAVIVLEPELEIWVWSTSPRVDECLGWTRSQPEIRAALRKAGFAFDASGKPVRPKEAMEWALHKAQKRRSSAIYQQLAEQVPLSSCNDTAFRHFVRTLQSWFPKSGG